MLPGADMTIKEVPPPQGMHCRSGHIAPAKFRRIGPMAPEEPTKFFQISSAGNPKVNGVYCEPCLIIANAMSKNQMRIE